MDDPLNPEHTKIVVEIIVQADDAQLERIKENIQKQADGLLSPITSDRYGSSSSMRRLTFDLAGRYNTALQLEHVGDWVLAAGLPTVKHINFTFSPIS